MALGIKQLVNHLRDSSRDKEAAQPPAGSQSPRLAVSRTIATYFRKDPFIMLEKIDSKIAEIALELEQLDNQIREASVAYAAEEQGAADWLRNLRRERRDLIERRETLDLARQEQETRAKAQVEERRQQKRQQRQEEISDLYAKSRKNWQKADSVLADFKDVLDSAVEFDRQIADKVVRPGGRRAIQRILSAVHMCVSAKLGHKYGFKDPAFSSGDNAKHYLVTHMPTLDYLLEEFDSYTEAQDKQPTDDDDSEAA